MFRFFERLAWVAMLRFGFNTKSLHDENGWQCCVFLQFSFVTEGLGGNAPFFKVFLTIFSVFERQCTVFLTLLGPIYRLGLGRFLGGYAPFYPRYNMALIYQALLDI